MSAEQEFYDMASALRDEGVGELVSAPMGLGCGDPEEARAAIRRYRAEAAEVAPPRAVPAEATPPRAACLILEGHVPGAWSEEFPYTMCRECGWVDQAPPAPIPGSPPRWVLWLGGKLRRA